jgi:hypothetical protein
LIVATHTSNIYIYNGNRVIWLAKGPVIPVAIKVASIGPLQSALVILDDEGLLTVCYLGTTPPTSVLGLSEGREPDWEAVQERRKALMRLIKDKGSPGVELLNEEAMEGDICIRTQVLIVPCYLLQGSHLNMLDTWPNILGRWGSISCDIYTGAIGVERT